MTNKKPVAQLNTVGASAKRPLPSNSRTDLSAGAIRGAPEHGACRFSARSSPLSASSSSATSSFETVTGTGGVIGATISVNGSADFSLGLSAGVGEFIAYLRVAYACTLYHAKDNSGSAVAADPGDAAGNAAHLENNAENAPENNVANAINVTSVTAEAPPPPQN